jgi:hypothetical protein
MAFDALMSTGIPFAPLDVLLGVGVALTLVVGVACWVSTWPDRKVIVAALIAKFLAGAFYAAVVVYYFGDGSDSLGYHETGMEYAEVLRADLASGTTAYLSLDPFFGVAGNSTTRMDSLSGLLHFLFRDSFLAVSAVCAFLGFIGQLLIYRTFVTCYPDARVRLWWQVGILFFPTLTFWSSGLLKDPLGILGLGCALWGAHAAFRTFRLKDVLLTLLGVYVLFLFRPQMLPVLMIALVPWFLQMSQPGPERALRMLMRWVVLGACAVAGIVILLLVSELEPRYSLTTAPEEIVHQRHRYEPSGGGSTDVESISVDASWSGLLWAWPEAMVFMLYRPLPSEAFASPVHLLAGTENLVLLVLTLRALYLAFTSGRRCFTTILRSPLFLTCLVFLILSGFVVGLSTPNLGTISRYRLPVDPFFVGLVTIIELQAHRLRWRSRGIVVPERNVSRAQVAAPKLNFGMPRSAPAPAYADS